nr:na(+)/h(+) antiporter 1 [Quercus suber]
MRFLLLRRESQFHFRPERLALAEIWLRLERQRPDHLFVRAELALDLLDDSVDIGGRGPARHTPVAVRGSSPMGRRGVSASHDVCEVETSLARPSSNLQLLYDPYSFIIFRDIFAGFLKLCLTATADCRATDHSKPSNSSLGMEDVIKVQVWDQIEATPAHISYLLLSVFLITYVLFTKFIRNRLHLSEPPIALLFGILIGPRILGWVTPNFCGVNGCPDAVGIPDGIGGWGWGDNVIQEITRVIVGVQVRCCNGRGSDIRMVADISAVAACLTPTDPILAASILANSQFSQRVPKRLKDLLSAESGCNDGVSFPFLYIGIFFLQQSTIGSAFKDWFLITILWQCTFGVIIGLILGTALNRILRFSYAKEYVDYSGFTVFYLLAALLAIGIGSTLGADDFLVAFGAGYGFARDGWFAKETENTHIPEVIDLLLNSAMFVYLGTIVPWNQFSPSELTPNITPGRLVGFVLLALLFRRLPVVLALYRWIPDVHTAREALFAGHFGPMGVGALFLAIEARAMLENDSAIPDPHPPKYGYPYSEKERAVYAIWPIVCFTVMTSTFVHGLSVVVISVVNHWRRPEKDRAPLLAGETDPLNGMDHDDGEGRSEREGASV